MGCRKCPTAREALYAYGRGGQLVDAQVASGFHQRADTSAHRGRCQLRQIFQWQLGIEHHPLAEQAQDARAEIRHEHQCNIPWAILLDPTNACNLHCTGCWAAEYGHKLNLDYEEIDDIINQGVALGLHIYIYTGGEPLVRKHDLIRLCEAHPDCSFLRFTNATLIDEDFRQDLLRVSNFVAAISAEGSREATDARRGEGTYDKVAAAMELLCSHDLPFGVSTCVTSANAESVCSEEFVDWMIEQGALFCWMFTYMPVGAGAHCTDLQKQESAEHLCGKCRTFADEWAPVAERMWNNPADPRHPYRADITANMADTDKEKFTAQGRTFEKMTE